MVGSGRAAALGIFVRGGEVLERLAKVDRVVFDKTGTLTEHRAEVAEIVAVPGATPTEVLSLASAVEADSDHPIALAIREVAPAGARVATGVRSVAGSGVAGTVDGHCIEVGRADPGTVPATIAGEVAAREQRGETVVAVRVDDQVVGAVSITTPLRPEAGPAVARLQAMGLEPVVLSGDTEPAVRTLAAEVGIASAYGGLSPDGKLAELASLREGAVSVLMVGDGINDAPALAAADVGCAIGSGSEATSRDERRSSSRERPVRRARRHRGRRLDLRGHRAELRLGDGLQRRRAPARPRPGSSTPWWPPSRWGSRACWSCSTAFGWSASAGTVSNGYDPPDCEVDGGVVASVAAAGRALRGAGGDQPGRSHPQEGQSLLPTLPSLEIRTCPPAVRSSAYLDPGGAGVNQLHLIFSGTPRQVAPGRSRRHGPSRRRSRPQPSVRCGSAPDTSARSWS